MSAKETLADLLLEGVRCPKSPLHVLSRNWDAVRLILDTIENQLHDAIDWQVTGATHVGKVDFPPPLKHEDGVSFQEIYFNMMPFLMPAKHWYEADKPLPTLPPALHRYSDMIRQCLEFCPGEAEKVCYITVEEGWVNASVAQRRPGLHTDSPGAPSHELVSKCELVMPWHHWGFGMVMKHVCEGGIFLASNTTDSCRVYDCVLKDPSVVGKLGDLEHMRHVLDRGPRRCDLKSKKQLREEREEWPPYPPKKENSTRHNSNSTYPAQVRWRGHRVHMRPVVERQTAMVRKLVAQHSRERDAPVSFTLRENQLCWITDRTPHESLPMKDRTFRQYFRLVTSNISGWYAQHSTPSEYGVVPPPEVAILEKNKFEDGI